MSSQEEESKESFEAFLSDLFWLKKLPSKETESNDLLHLSEFVEFLKSSDFTFDEDVKKVFFNWMNVQEEIDNELVLDGDKVHRLLNASNNIILPLYVKNCNACLVIRKEKGLAKVSVFTVHPKNNEIMTKSGDLVTDYPEVTIQVKDENLSMLYSDEFATLLQDLFSNQISQIRPKSKKAGSVEDEGRNVVSSVLITEWLVALLGGESIDGKQVNKKIRNSIEWSNAMHPYRRSGMWISIKIVFQLILVWKYGEIEGKALYKAILIKYFIHIAKKNINEISDEVKLQIISKLAIRIKKLDGLILNIDSLLSDAHKFISEQRAELDLNWKNICCNDTFKIDLCLESAADKSGNIRQQLIESTSDINIFKDFGQNVLEQDEIVPKSINRIFDISQFTNIRKSDGGEESLLELFIIEEWVRKDMMFERDCTPDNLNNLFTNYVSVAKMVYAKDPIAFSRMVLTTLNIIRKLIDFANKKSSLFREYKTGIDASILNYLLVTRRVEWQYLFELETYFKTLEQSATYQPDFLLSSITPTSFSSRFAQTDVGMQELREKIEKEIEGKLQEKRNEVRNADKLYKEYKQTANSRKHEEYYNDYYRCYLCHSSCSKCWYNRQADSMDVKPYEKYLPEEGYRKNAIVFELMIPDQFRCLNNALIGFFEIVHSYNPSQKADSSTEIWKNYLWRHNSNQKNNRVSLTSSQKSYTRSHYYNEKHHPNLKSEDHFIIENALNLKISVDDKFVGFSKSEIVEECSFSIGNNGKYNGLDMFLKSFSHNQNDALSNQFNCAPKLSLSEFIEFGSFRSGYHLQMHNLAKVLSNNLLSFDQQEVCFLIIQSLLQSCPSASVNSWWRETNDPCRDLIFSNELVSLLATLLKKIENNWKSINQLVIIVFSARKLLEICDYTEVLGQVDSLLFRIRDICVEWLDKTEQVLLKISDNPTECASIRNLQTEIACCCCLSFHPTRQSLLVDFSKWLLARSIIYENLILNNVGLDSLPQFRKCLLRETIKTSQLVQDSIHESLFKDSSELSIFLKEKWSEVRNVDRLDLNWSRYEESENWYNAKLEKVLIQVNIINGALLINHSPIGRLPEKITKRNEYQRIFKNMVLDVQPGAEFNSFVTKNAFGGSFFKFKLISVSKREILIISEITNDNKELVYFPHESFGNDIPKILKDKFGHWIDKESNCILFKPIFFLDSNFSTINYTLNLKSRLLQHIIDQKYFIDNRSKIFTEIMKILSRIEVCEHVHMYYQEDTLFVELPRKGLIFILSSDHSQFVCKQFGMTLSTDFDIGTLIGLQQGLKLVDAKSERVVVIIPNGNVTKRKNHIGHITVDIDLNSSSSDPPFFTFSINRQLERLEAENSLSSWLFLAYLHGCTSYFLPDPLTKLCGYESAISILKSKRCLQLHSPMNNFEIELLASLSSLSPHRCYYPKHLTDMQQTSWNSNLSSLVQLDSYLILCERIQKQNSKLFSAIRTGNSSYPGEEISATVLHWKAYFKDSHFYSKDCEIASTSYSSDATSWRQICSNDKVNLCRNLSYSLRNNCISSSSLSISQFISEIQNCEVDVQTIENWATLDIKSCFLELTHKLQEFSKRKFEIFLTMLRYLEYDTTLVNLLGIIYLNKGKIMPYPSSNRKRSIKSYTVEKNEIETILEKHKMAFSDLFYTLSRENQDKYDKLISDEKLRISISLKDAYLKDWFTFDSSNYIKSSYKEEMKKLFNEKKDNYALHSYLQHLHSMVNNIPYLPNSILLPFQQIRNILPDKTPKWKFIVDYSEEIQNSSIDIIKMATEIFETGQAVGHIEILYKKIEDAIQGVMTPCNNLSNQSLYYAGLWPRVTKTNILKLLLNENTNQQLKNLIGGYGVLITLLQRSERLESLQNSQMATLYARELENKGHENWKPSEHPYWLILEIEMNIMIRPVQVRVANHMINSENNMVMQFNMGEGKSSVIIPMLILELGKTRNQLVRLTVLKSLLLSNYKSLRFKLGGILDKPVIITPFNRDYQVLHCTVLQTIYSNCMKQGGVLITVPEYRLSFELKCIESIKSKESNYEQLVEVQHWLENNCRDLLDESDEILHVRYQLIYTVGNQLKIDGRDQRWNVLQKVFRSIKKYSKELFNLFGSSCVELREMNCFEHSFPHLRILDPKAFALLTEQIVNDILDGKLKGIFISIKPEFRNLFKQFLTCEEIDDSKLQSIKRNSKESQWETLLILRGLLAYGTLELVLERRWRVNYGVGNSRLIAVPFRAKDIPSERSEYGHPDIAILLTLLSYYYSGLDNSQLEFIFEELLALDDPEKEYCKWVEEGKNQIPEVLKALSNINLSDYHQKMKIVFPFFKHSMAAIDFYLNKCVFPKECKQFPKKLTSSSWNLCNEKKYITSGFSGTKSFLLPISIKSNELDELLDTSKNVESHILKNTEYHVISNDQSCKQVIQDIVKSSKPTRVLLDVGALMLEMTNEVLAKYWLEISNPNEIHAAIYFNDKDELTVMDRYNHVTIFDLSPYKNKLEQCVTYIDDVHTRGTDIKFPESTRAAVTLGNGLSNERFAQACMRMRQLCSKNGHTVSFWASKEVDSSIKKLSNNDVVTTLDIVNWTHFNTNQMESDNLLQWAIQGLIYSHKLWLKQELGLIDIQQYYEKYLEDEVLALQSFYGLERKKQLLLTIFKLKELHVRSLHSQIFKNGIFEANIEKIIEKLSNNNMEIFSQTLNEEQERELENELEEEKQVFRPPKLKPYDPELDYNLSMLLKGYGLTTYSFLNIKDLVSDTAIEYLPNIWNCNIYATKSMKNVVISEYDSKFYYYKRPIDWFVHSLEDNFIVLICPYEANEIFKYINENGNRHRVTLNRFCRRVHVSDDLLYDNTLLSIPSQTRIVSLPRIQKLEQFLPDLFILSSSLYLKNEMEQSIICKFLAFAPKPYNSVEMKAYERGDIDENGKIVYKSQYYQSLFGTTTRVDFDPILLVEKLLSIFDRDDTFQDSHLYMIIRQLQKPFK